MSEPWTVERLQEQGYEEPMGGRAQRQAEQQEAHREAGLPFAQIQARLPQGPDAARSWSPDDLAPHVRAAMEERGLPLTRESWMRFVGRDGGA